MKTICQFLKFGIIGFSNTVISYFLYLGMMFALKPADIRWDFYIANIVGFVLSVLWSFYWNNKFVFKTGEGESRNIWKALLKTYLSYAFSGFVLSNILLWLWVDYLGVSKFVAPIINLVVTVPVNFVLNKLWAFKTKKE